MNKKINIILAILLTICTKSFSQEYFDITQDFPCDNCGKDYSPTADIKSIKSYAYKTIETVFDSLTNHSSIEFNYPQGGCQQRAQIMSTLLKGKYKIQHARIWLFAPANLSETSTIELEIDDPNNLTTNGRIKWGYHVAPLVLARSNSKIDTLIIDPSINSNKPLSIKEWLGAIRNSEKSKYTFLKDSKYFFNVQCCNADGSFKRVINGFFYDFTSFAKDNLTLEKGLALNDVAMHIYKMYIQDETDQTRIQYLKSIFGNATTLDYFLTNVSVCSTFGCSTPYQLTMSERELMSLYGEIVVEAKSYYQKRVLFWSKITEKYSNN